jgi:hypothetical protein
MTATSAAALAGGPRTMSFRRLGVGLIVAGVVAALAGFVASSGDADRFTLSSVAGAATLAGIAVVVIGILAVLFARPLADLYRPGQRVTLRRRLLQVGLPAVAFVAVLAVAAGIASAHRP